MSKFLDATQSMTPGPYDIHATETNTWIVASGEDSGSICKLSFRNRANAVALVAGSEWPDTYVSMSGAANILEVASALLTKDAPETAKNAKRYAEELRQHLARLDELAEKAGA